LRCSRDTFAPVKFGKAMWGVAVRVEINVCARWGLITVLSTNLCGMTEKNHGISAGVASVSTGF